MSFLQFVLLALLLADAAGYPDVESRRTPLFALVALFTILSGVHDVWLWGRKAASTKANTDTRALDFHQIPARSAMFK